MLQRIVVGACLTLTKSIKSRRMLSRGQSLSTLLTKWLASQVGHCSWLLTFVLLRHSKQREWRHGRSRACLFSSLNSSLHLWHLRNILENSSIAIESIKIIPFVLLKSVVSTKIYTFHTTCSFKINILMVWCSTHTNIIGWIIKVSFKNIVYTNKRLIPVSEQLFYLKFAFLRNKN